MSDPYVTLPEDRYIANRRELAGGRDLLAEVEECLNVIAELRVTEQARRLSVAEAQLASVPALVEALRRIERCRFVTGAELARVEAALAKWEQAQGEKP